MASPAEKFDRNELEAHVVAVVCELLEELGNPYATGTLRGSARLAQDLGLGSLERVELLIRLEHSFDVRLPERVIAEAESLDEVIEAIGEATRAAASASRAAGSERDAEAGLQPGSHPGIASPAAPLGISRTPAAVPASAETWQEILRYRAQVNARDPHLLIYEGSAEPHVLTFGDLFAGAQAVAASLIRRGIGHGDAVALMLPTGRDFYFTFAGVLLAGGVPVPIYPPVRADRIAEYAARQSAILSNAEARLLVTFHDAERAARLLRPRVPSLQGIVTARELAKPEQRSSSGVSGTATALASAARGRIPRAQGDDLALLQYTSGSTDAPKGVQLTHQNLLASARAMGEAIDAHTGDVCVTWLPLYHDMGLIGMWLAPLYYGLPVAVESPLAFLARPESWLLALHKHRGTITAAPNFAYELAARKIADRDIAGIDLGQVRAMMNGAEPVNPETLERFAARFASYGLHREALAPVYGLAEASLGVAIPPMGRGPVVDRVVRETFEREGRAIPPKGPLGPSASSRPEVIASAAPKDEKALSFVSVGRAVPRHEVRIVDAEGRETPERQEGVLWFRGPSTTRGYFRNASASAALFPQGPEAGWLNSGDRAYRAGGEIFITGRVKDIILKGGRNLYPQEIEELAGRAPGIRKGNVVAFGVADATSGTERLVIVAETRQRPARGGAASATPAAGASQEEISKKIAEQVSSAIGVPPDTIELLPPRSIPKTSSGKLRRSETRQRYLAGTLRRPAPPAWRQIARLGLSSGMHTVARAATRALRRAGQILYGVYALGVFAVVVLAAWVAVQCTRTRRGAAHVTATALRILLALIGCRVEVRGREHLEALAAPIVMVCNHTSDVDVLVLMAALGADYHFVAKAEINSWPILGTFLRKMGHLSFDRSDPRQRMRASEQMLEALRRGESVFVFPEGTFTYQKGVRTFQLGAFKAAAYAGCPILPMAVRGARQFLREGSYLPRPSHITITLCRPLKPTRTTEWREIVRLRDAARGEIQKESGEPML